MPTTSDTFECYGAMLETLELYGSGVVCSSGNEPSSNLQKNWIWCLCVLYECTLGDDIAEFFHVVNDCMLLLHGMSIAVGFFCFRKDLYIYLDV